LSSYNWLLKLKRAGYLSQRWDEEGKGFLWTLDRAGFSVIKRLLPPLREEGFRSEAPYHDWTVSAFHLGDWLISPPQGTELLSEQELRRLHAEDYPAWVPKDMSHRPDGYWHSRRESAPGRTVALEVELSRKQNSAYQNVGTFYGESAQIGRVLWVVRSLSDAERIRANLQKGPGSVDKKHSFLRLSSFLKQGWSAAIEAGAGSGLSVQSFLEMALAVPKNETHVKPAWKFTSFSLLETRIMPKKPVTSGARREGSVSIPTMASAIVSPAPHETRLTIQPEVSR
jgi:hypothetical protein